MKRIGLVLVVLALVALTAGAVLANGTKIIHAKALTDHECDSTEWHFVINQISEGTLAPSSIHVAWANGASENVSMWKFTGGVAHYVTTANLGSTVTEASAEIYEAWSGQFNLSSGPCAPLCAEVDTHYGEWGSWSPWSECSDGVQSRTRTREVWTTDKNDPSVECDRWTETETQTQWCDLCVEVDTHYGDWGNWSGWSECVDGEKSRTRSREVWTTDINHPEHECDRWVETETQTIGCEFCTEVDTHYGEWSLWSEWSKCINGEQTRTRTREVWTTDKNDPSVECDRWTETETQTKGCEEPTPTPTPPPVSPAECNQPPTEAGCKEGLAVYNGLCRKPDCLEEPSCICPEVPCWPRLNVTLTGCIPEKVVVSIWFNFDEENKTTPSGYMERKQLWEGKTLLFDLDLKRPYRVWAWTEQKWYYLGEVMMRECRETDIDYNFPCPVPTPTPELPKELPVTGFPPVEPTVPVETISGIGLALIAIGGLLRKIARH